MSARPPQYGVGAVLVVLLGATVLPWVGVGTASAAAGSASFADTAVYEQTGDVANITVTTSKPATVNLGSPDTNFWLQVDVGKGTTTLRLNTYKAGQSDRYRLSEMVWAAKGSITGRTLRTPSIDGALDPAQYQMNVTANGQEKAVAALVVQERTTNEITASIAPARTDVTKLKTAADVRAASVPPWNGSVAREDWLFLHVNATGVRGALSKAKLDGDGGVMRVDFEQTNPPMNGQGNEFTGAEVENVVTGPKSEGFYLVVDTAKNGIEAGDRYEVRFTIPKKSELSKSEQTVSTNVYIAERRVNIEEYDRGTLTVEGKTTLRGKTTLTPGSIINISARSADIPPFHRPKTLTVSGERTFEVTFDFSDIEPGRKFQIRLPDQKRTIPAQVKPPKTTTQTTTENGTDETTTTTTAPDKTTTATTTTRTTTTKTTVAGLTQVGMEDTQKPLTQRVVGNGSGGNGEGGEEGGSGGVPGFGPVASVVAVVAAALLAIRRQ